VSHVRGYYIKFIPDANEFGNLYNKLGILVQDDAAGQSQFLVMYYFLTILPVNDRPSIFLNKINIPFGVEEASGSTVQYSIVPGISLKPIAKITDPDSFAGDPSMTVKVQMATSDSSAILTALDEFGNIVSISSNSPLIYTGSIFQVNQTLTSLTFVSSGQGVSDISVYINDNGATGNCPPNSIQTPNQDGTCPQVRQLNILVSVDQSNSISGPLAIAASAGLGGFLIVGVAVAIAAVKKFKNKKSDGWREFNEDILKDYAQDNPIYQEDTVSHENPLYISSRESIELSNVDS